MRNVIALSIMFVIILLAFTAKRKKKAPMKTSAEGRKAITFEEGKRYKAYKDTKGFWTTGIGHLIKPNEQHLIKKVLTETEVQAMFDTDLAIAETYVNKLASIVPLTQGQYDALVSIAFNVGNGNFIKSALYKAVKGNDLKAASRLIVEKGENKPRRKREQALFLS